ncbi:MAG TPA: hypothetical protein PKL77_06080 [Candidatus Omnitrophota bacterium]|nr:hypothetical protein [Candidatus Omnitrophota bacterium]
MKANYSRRISSLADLPESVKEEIDKYIRFEVKAQEHNIIARTCEICFMLACVTLIETFRFGSDSNMIRRGFKSRLSRFCSDYQRNAEEYSGAYDDAMREALSRHLAMAGVKVEGSGKDK